MKFKTTSEKLKQYSNSYHENRLPRHQFHSLQYTKELATQGRDRFIHVLQYFYPITKLLSWAKSMLPKVSKNLQSI